VKGGLCVFLGARARGASPRFRRPMRISGGRSIMNADEYREAEKSGDENHPNTCHRKPSPRTKTSGEKSTRKNSENSAGEGERVEQP